MANWTVTQKMQAFIASSLMVMVGFALWKLTDAAIPKENDQAFNILLGAILMQFANLIAFMFPSNAESATKNDTINTLANAAQAANAPITKTTTEELKAGETPEEGK